MPCWPRPRAPRNVNPVDWAAERAWLLLRMGEADAGADARLRRRRRPLHAARCSRSGCRARWPTPTRPACARCRRASQKIEPNIVPLVDAMCASLAGEPETRRGADRFGAPPRPDGRHRPGACPEGRRRGLEHRPRGDHRMGAGRPARHLALRPGDRDRADLPRSADQCRAAAASGVAGRARRCSSPQDRLESARIATGLGVFSSQSLIDLYSTIYDATGPGRHSRDRCLAGAAGVRRQGPGSAARRHAAICGQRRRTICRCEARASDARPGRGDGRARSPTCSRMRPNLIASMLAAGYDRDAARWAPGDQPDGR